MGQEKTEKIIAAARQVFIRYGYRRVTMADLAEAAQMSRPALYLVFPSKEQIFIEVINDLTTTNLQTIRDGLTRLKTLDEKLAFAFEIWHVKPFELIQSSPDASDLYVSIKEVAPDVIMRGSSEFENLLTEILDTSLPKKRSLKMTTQQIARILRTSAKGFTNEAQTANDLRQLITDMRKIVLGSL